MKTKLITAAVTLSVVALFAACWMQPSRVGTVVCSNVTLSSAGLRLHPVSLRTVAPCSEIAVELLGSFHWIDEGRTPRLVRDGGGEVQIDGYLITRAGMKVPLTDVSPFGLNNKMFVRLSNPALTWKTQDYNFREIVLWSNTPVAVGRVVWLSDDPRNHKSGVIEDGLQ